MAHLLGCENVEVEYPSKRVLDAVTLGIDDGDRIGIVGANGDGKSTLLRLLAGEMTPDAGRVIAKGGLRVSMLGQADALDPTSTVESAVVGERPEHEWASDARVRAILRGLIADVAWDGRVGELSGGQRRRVDLARVLVQDSDVLLLDEPTNHLDIHAIAWLAEHLKARWPRKTGALLVVTHDRWFLDEVCSGMWEVHDGRVDRFEGGYSAYLLQRVERAETARVAEQKRRNTLRRELAWLARRPQARGTKPKFRIDAANELIADEPPARNALELRRTAMSRLGKQVIDLEGVTERFGDRTVLDDVTWHIGAGDRIGLLGGNGTGKTTLINVIRGALLPSSGTVRIGSTVKFAVLTQHLAELEAHANERVREVLARYHTRYEIDGKELTPAQLLERLGFESAHLQAYVRTLSGGQKRRLQLILILLERPNVLVLDEPDNDLDTDMLALVEELLDSWPGTLLLITHDRQLMERVTDDQFALVGGHVRHMPGGVDEYLRLVDLLEERKATAAPGKAPAVAAAPSGGSTLARADEYAAKKALASTERKMSTLAKRVGEARDALHATDPYDPGALIEAQRKLTEVEGQLSDLEDEWLRLSELLS